MISITYRENPEVINYQVNKQTREEKFASEEKSQILIFPFGFPVYMLINTQ